METVIETIVLCILFVLMILSGLFYTGLIIRIISAIREAGNEDNK